MEEHRKELSKILGLTKRFVNLNTKDELPSWAEIYTEIGRLKERADRPEPKMNEYPQNPSPVRLLGETAPPFHYHNGSKCYLNPCVWC